MTENLALMSASQLVAKYRDGTVSPVEATQAALNQIEKHNGALMAFNLVDAVSALDEARKSEERWRLGTPRGRVDGVPTAVKDILLTKGWPTLRGSKTIDPDQPWEEDAPCVARLREHGAVLIGKTTTPEYGWKGVTDSPLTGITRNPWNPERTPGGSSGGSAVAVACGMSALALGTDGGGSIRIPAGFTGIFGHKPTFGRVPAYPASPFGTVAHIGPMTRTVMDAAMMMTVIAEPDARDWYALPPTEGAKSGDYAAVLERGIKGMRIAFSPTLGGHRVDPEIAKLVADAVRVFEDLGAEVEEAEPDLSESATAFRAHWFAGAANLVAGLSPVQKKLLDPGLREVAAEGAKYGLLEYFAAVKQREAIGLTMNLFFEKYDLLLTPTLPLPAFEAGLEWPKAKKSERWTDWTPFSYPFNLSRQPAASAPCGFTSDGLPAGLQIVGPLYQDSRVLRAAHAFETARPFKMPDL